MGFLYLYPELHFAFSVGHRCVCERPLGTGKRPPQIEVYEVVFHLLFLFRNIDQNSEVLCHLLDYRVAGNLIVENHRCPTAWRTLRTHDSAFFRFLSPICRKEP